MNKEQINPKLKRGIEKRILLRSIYNSRRIEESESSIQKSRVEEYLRQLEEGRRRRGSHRWTIRYSNGGGSGERGASSRGRFLMVAARIFNFPRGKPDGAGDRIACERRGASHRAFLPILGDSQLEYHPLPPTFSLVFNYPRIKENHPLSPLFSFFLPNRRKRGVSSLFDLLRIVSILNSFSNFCSPCRVSHNKKLEEKLIHAAFRISITDRDSRAHGKHVAFASWIINCPPVASPLAEFEISLPSPLPYLLKCKLLPYLSYIALSSVLSTTYLPLVFIKLDFTSREEERRGEER